MARLALVQMLVRGGEIEANLRRAEERIEEAAKAGAEVILLPEALDCGWTDSSAIPLAASIPDGGTCKRFRAAAQRNGVFVCAGLTESAGGVIHNAAVLIDRRGNVVLHHRKINELDIAAHLYTRGDRIQVTQTPLGTTGVMICADGFAEDYCVSRSLGLMGARVILSPSAWAVPADHDNDSDPYGKLWLDCYRPVASDYGLWIASASNVGPIRDGPWAGRRCIGCSLVIGPDGQVLSKGPYGSSAETILYVSL